MRALVVMAVVLAAYLASAEAAVRDCAGTQPLATVNFITVSHCDVNMDGFCRFWVGQNLTVNVEFTSDNEIQSTYVVMDITQPLDYDRFLTTDACENLGLECPIKKNKQTKLSFVAPVPSGANPKLFMYSSESPMRVKLFDKSNGSTIFCKEFTAVIYKQNKSVIN